MGATAVVVVVELLRAEVDADAASDDTNETAFADVVANEILSRVVAGAATLFLLALLRAIFDPPLFRPPRCASPVRIS